MPGGGARDGLGHAMRGRRENATKAATFPKTRDAPPDFPVPPDAHGMIRLLPHRHGTDGFTAVRLRRAPAA